MAALFLTLFAVLVTDQALKFSVGHALGPNMHPLGPFGSLQIVPGQLWISRVRGLSGHIRLWLAWVMAAAVLMIMSTWIPLSPVAVGLLLGGSLSNAVDNSTRGWVSDYIRLRFWPPFNLADIALVSGAVGSLSDVLAVVRGTAS
jgi:lipoprotein signal peptidase